MFPYVMFIFEPGYSIPRLCCFFLVFLWLSSLLIRRMFILQEILIPTIPKIRSMSEGTIWLSEDWTINSTRLTLSLPFFLQFLEALCLWIWTESLFYFFRTRFNKYRRHRFFASDFATSLSSLVLRLSLLRKLRNRSELRIRRQRWPV